MQNFRDVIDSIANSKHVGLTADFGLGNPARTPPKKALETRTKVAEQYGGNFYAPSAGTEATRKAVAQFSWDIDGIRLDPDKNIWISECGTCWFLELLLKEMLKDRSNKDETINVYLPVPYYGRHAEATQLPFVSANFIRYGGGKTYIDRLEEELKDARGGVVVVSSVDNPTTTVLSVEDMERLLRLTQNRNMVLFMDDAYRHVYRNHPIPSIFKAIPGAISQKVVATLSWSKAWQWPGLKGGALVGNPDIIGKAFKAKSRISEGGDPATQAAMTAAVLDYQFLEETRQEYRRLEQFMVNGLQDAGWGEAVGSPASIFLHFAHPEHIRKLGTTSADFGITLARLGIITFPFEMFGGSGDIRFCMRGTDERIGNAIGKIRKFLKG